MKKLISKDTVIILALSTQLLIVGCASTGRTVDRGSGGGAGVLGSILGIAADFYMNEQRIEHEEKMAEKLTDFLKRQ